MAFFDKLKEGLEKTRRSMRSILVEFTGEHEEFYEELEEALIMADTGGETSFKIVSRLRDRVREENLLGEEEIKECLALVLSELLDSPGTEFNIDSAPAVILVVGVNGVGKTTTIGKLGSKFTSEGKKVVMAAADTFRAAAADQLALWAKRANCDIVKHGEGADPAAVVFDAISSAKAKRADILIIDTAGRLHNKVNLMNELAKIRKILERELPESSIETLMVVDATTGQNGLIQAMQFKEFAEISGVVLTKLDGTAKGGIVFAIADQMKIPVRFVGVGEGIDDLLEFDSLEFSRALIS
ncbi:MAG: signal recognition particle-docking protein FtsY [Candidatus Scatomorpha sp.]|jgi:fused signal recognition particle receptor